jgi:predicted hydrocarbon binding protein
LIGASIMEIWKRPAQGELSRVELVDMKVHNTLFTTFYVQIVSLMKEKYGVEGTKEALRRLGEGVALTMFDYREPVKSKSLKKIINDIADFGFYYSVKFEDIKGSDNFLIVDKNCPVCWEGIVEKDVPYCCIVDGFLEQYLNLAHDHGWDIPKVRIRVSKSKATGDDYCEHLVEIL